MRITIVVDNQAQPPLQAEPGLALWIEVGDLHLLFDTGEGAALLPNAEALGIPLERTDWLIISHGHDDHTGGLTAVLDRAPQARVAVGRGADRPRYGVLDGRSPSIGVPPAAVAALHQLPSDRVRWVDQPCELAPGVGLTGPIPRLTDFEDTGGPFFLDPAGVQSDTLDDEQALWIRTPEGLVVVVGCAHSGICNTLTCAAEVSGASRLRAVIGGWHLGAASPERLQRTTEALRAWQADCLAPCHCTGRRAVTHLASALPGRIKPGGAGTVFEF